MEIGGGIPIRTIVQNGILCSTVRYANFPKERFCNDLGYDPEECIKLAVECQKKFEK